MKSSFFVLIVVFFLGGCSSAYRVNSPEEANRKIGQGGATLTLSSGKELEVREISVRTDSTFSIDASTGEVQQIATPDIISIQRTDHWGGAIEGLMFGGLSGGVAGFAYGSSLSGGDQHDLGVGLATFSGIVLGGVGGLIIGVLEGHQYTIEIVRDTLRTSRGEHVN